MLWRCYIKEEAKIVELQEKAKGLEISLDQILGEGLYFDSQDQALCDEHTLSLCSTAALKFWDRIQKSGKRVESYLRDIQRKTFTTFFLQRQSSAVQIGVNDLKIDI